MNKSKKQIWIVWYKDEWGKYVSPVLITTSITKIQKFLIKKIEQKEEIYNTASLSIKEQITEFKQEFKYNPRNWINSKLHHYQYEYYYDGEEI